MDRKKLTLQIASLIFSIFIVNYLAGKFYWYSAISWFDMMMHFLGGFWLGLVAVWLLSHKKSLPVPSLSFIFQALLFVLVFGIFWEIFELIFFNYIASNFFDVVDTASDIFFDLAGGVFAILHFFKRIMLTNRNEL